MGKTVHSTTYPSSADKTTILTQVLKCFLPDEIARRLSQTRRFSVDNIYRQKVNASRTRKKSSTTNNNDVGGGDNIVITRNHSETDLWHSPSFNPRTDEFQMYPDKIKAWMNRSNELVTISDEHEEHNDQVFSSKSDHGSGDNLSSINSINNFKDSKLSDSMINELCRTSSTLHDVTWEIGTCDLYIEVEEILFPVEKNFIVYVSEKFQLLIDGDVEIQNGSSVFLTLNGYSLNEIKTVLAFIHSVNDEPISDENVASLLQLGDEFKISRLVYQCEKHLRESKTFNPVIMSHLAKQYSLHSLLEYSYSEISKIDGIEETQEFQLLDAVAQNIILKFLLKRYKKATRTLSQFDVHLCNHHGNDPKNSQCCFRAATYSTENNRTFLVKMENPETKLIQRFNSVLACDSESLVASTAKKDEDSKKAYNRYHSV